MRQTGTTTKATATATAATTHATMAEVRQLLSLSDDPSQSCEAVDSIASLHLREVDRKLGDLRKLRTELRHMVDDCQHGAVGECRIIEVLSG